MKTGLAFAALPLLFMGSAALAVGYEPVHLNQRQAAEFYRSLRFLLDGDFRCPAGQTPLSGLVTGGDAGSSGVQRTNILFSKGARLQVESMWEALPKRKVTVKISCP
ncbi:hypothetical protein [Sphingomonas sp.]|uniref:hypothetical protein n=1 Tax=Sphingomonas sp. TaxID=28214 RepID=UPI0038A39555